MANLTLFVINSMEALLSANPNILQQLREDLQELVGRRLRGLGVDPVWTSLPPNTFRNKMAVLTHQRQITAKVLCYLGKLNLDENWLLKYFNLNKKAGPYLFVTTNKVSSCSEIQI